MGPILRRNGLKFHLHENKRFQNDFTVSQDSTLESC